MKFTPGFNDLQLISLGTKTAFKARLARLNKRIKARTYRLREFIEIDSGSFWLFEAEDADEILGAVLQIKDGQVYAISEDVLNLLKEGFARKS